MLSPPRHEGAKGFLSSAERFPLFLAQRFLCAIATEARRGLASLNPFCPLFLLFLFHLLQQEGLPTCAERPMKNSVDLFKLETYSVRQADAPKSLDTILLYSFGGCKLLVAAQAQGKVYSDALKYIVDNEVVEPSPV